MSSSNRNEESSKSKFEDAFKKISELEIDLNVSQSELTNTKAKYDATKKTSEEFKL